MGQNLGHVAALVRESLITYLASLPRKVYGYQPVQFLAEGTSDDLLRKVVSDHSRFPDWLGVHPLYEIDVRVMEFARNAPFLGMYLNVCARRHIDATCRELAAAGFSVAGRYVGTRRERPDARMQAQFRLVGRVETIKDGRLQLADHREGESEVQEAEAFIDSAAFWDILDHCAGDRAASVRTRLDQALATFHRGPELLARLDKLRGFLAKQKLELAPGLSWTCDEFVSQAKAVGFPRVETAPSVVYVFDPTGRKTDTWHDRGMDQHGPYSTPTFSPSDLQVCVVCQKPTSFFPLAYLAAGQPFPKAEDKKIRELMVQADDGYVRDHIASTFHLVHYYRLLEDETPRADAIVRRVLRDQKPDGSWLLHPPSWDVHAGFDAVFVLNQLGGGRADCREAIGKAAAWALKCRNADGGFGHFPGYTSDIDAVYFHAGTLVMAGLLKPVDPLPKDSHLLGWGHLLPVPAK